MSEDVFQSSDYVEAVVSRFWEKVEKVSDGCWLWRAAVRKTDGVGVFGVDGKILYAHRFSWFLSRGCIPKGVEVRRTCGNRLCVRPGHLELRLEPAVGKIEPDEFQPLC